jgi:hypothetical protein
MWYNKKLVKLYFDALQNVGNFMAGLNPHLDLPVEV